MFSLICFDYINILELFFNNLTVSRSLDSSFCFEKTSFCDVSNIPLHCLSNLPLMSIKMWFCFSNYNVRYFTNFVKFINCYFTVEAFVIVTSIEVTFTKEPFELSSLLLRSWSRFCINVTLKQGLSCLKVKLPIDLFCKSATTFPLLCMIGPI